MLGISPLLKWAGRLGHRSNKLPQRLLGLSRYHRRLVCEALERRTLLSVDFAQTLLVDSIQAGALTRHQTLVDLPDVAQYAIASENGQDELIHANTSGAQGSIAIDPFIQQGKLTVPEGGANDEFGVSVALSGNTLVVGSPGANGAQGAAYIFTQSGSAWTQTAKLTASDGVAGDSFGSSVSISGNTVVVGAPSAPYDSIAHANGPGAAYVFTEPGSAWANMTQTAKLTASDGAAGNLFGSSVSISGSTVVVGAPGTFSVPGSAYVFTEPGSAWVNMTQTAKLTASDSAVQDYFGTSVSISDNTVVVGANGAKVGANAFQGAAYVFTEPGAAWADMTQTAKLTASDGHATNSFGGSVSIGGNTVVVGAIQANVGGNVQGAAYVFTEPGSAWTNMTQTAKLTASDGAAGNAFGKAVSISGNTVVVGVAAAKVGGNNGQGAAYEFTEPGLAWTDMSQTVKFTASNGEASDGFGSSVSISGNTVVVGAQNARFGVNLAQGSVYVFEQSQATSPVVTGIAPSSGTSAGGMPVTITGSGFAGATAVDFGTVPAGSFTVDSDTQITAAAPAGTGIVDVTVTTPGGTSAVSSVDHFTFKANLSIVGLCGAGTWWMAKSSGGSFVNQVLTSWSPTAGWQDVQVADVNGDGKDDIVGRASSGGWYVAINSDTGFVNQHWGSWDPNAGWQDVQIADVNGDGKADIVGRASSGAWYVAASNGSAFVSAYWGSWDPAAGWQDVHVADLNGDGNVDVIGRASSGAWYAAISSGATFVNQYWSSWTPTAGWRNVQVGDVNNDGKADIVGMTSSGGWYVVLSLGTSSVNQYWCGWDPSAGWTGVQLADMNGDGEAELVGMANSSTWYVVLPGSTGYSNHVWGGWNPNAGWQNVQAADLNGDGKADIVGRATSGAWYAALSSGTGFVNQYWGSWNPSAGWQPVLIGHL
jgi:hypothetical protein